jgi:hypothetical protein
MEMRKMRMRGSPLWPDWPAPAPGDEQGEQGRSGGAFWSREKETREGEGTEERGLGRKKSWWLAPTGLPCQGRKEGVTWPPVSSTQSRMSSSLQ